MGPKPIQDVALPKSANESTEPPAGPEIVHDIPVRQPSQGIDTGEPEPAPTDHETSFIVSDKNLGIPLPHLGKKDESKANPPAKDKKSSPVLATVVFLAALVCLAAGAYLKYFNGG